MLGTIRALTEEELEFVSGGNYVFVVTGTREPGWSPSHWFFGWGGYDSGGYDSGGSGGGSGDGEIVVTASVPSKCEANPITIVFNNTTYDGEDGAAYYVPENVTNDTLNNAWNHIVGLNTDGNILEKFGEIYNMYSDPAHPFHVDFKDYPAGNISYWSSAIGQMVETSPFEAFGNFFFGVLMTAAGFSMEETKLIAGLVQSLPASATKAEAIVAAGVALATLQAQDDPRDAPHVEFGAKVAAQYLAAESLAPGSAVTFMKIIQDSCSSSGGSEPPGGSSGGTGSGGGAGGGYDPNFHQQ